MKTHFTWSIETSRGNCPTCNEKTVLVTAPESWEPHEGDDNADAFAAIMDYWVVIREEVSGHFCPNCHKLVSLSLNTEGTPNA